LAAGPAPPPGGSDRERLVGGTATLGERLREHPRPALGWLAVLLVLVTLQFGAVLATVAALLDVVGAALPGGNPLLGAVTAVEDAATALPTLLSRETIPNRGWRTAADGPWAGTFLGLEPMVAWLVRFLLVSLYAVVFVGWLAYGYRLYVRHYRRADWTPRDDVLRRFRNHSWGKFGAAVVLAFVVMALFAPTLGPTTAEQDVERPFSHEVNYFDEDSGEVESILVGDANREARSEGAGAYNTGLWQYDAFDRFHPLGTMDRGQDLFTFVAYGARVSLFIGLVALAIMGVLATVLALVAAYYRGVVDLVAVLVGDSLQAIPLFLILIMTSAIFQGHWLDNIYDGAVLIALVYGVFAWPALWRAVRGPALEASTAAWVDAARAYGQTAGRTMRKHMLPSIVGYLLVYASMSFGGVIVTTAALSFLGIGVDAPTPEWGRAVELGQPYVATQSWHVGVVPGLLIVLVVTGFNALGDGIRDAIDPEFAGGGDRAEVRTGGGGGA
jgi:peptide/nickel transport system permease protein